MQTTTSDAAASSATSSADAERDLLIAWVLWIVVSAAIPVIGLVRDVLIHRRFGVHFSGQFPVLFGFLILTLTAPAILQWLVLRRRVKHDLQVAFGCAYLVAAWISAIATLSLCVYLQKTVFDGERAFDIARIRQ